MKKNNVLLIIPAYNEEENIVRVVSEVVEKYTQYDYVVVNDGSSDKTRKVCKDNNINILDLPVNLGLSGAVRSGMKYANFYGYDYAIQLDGDGQHSPEYIEDMLKCMQEKDADIVIGSRFKTEKKPFSARMLGSKLITLAIWITTGGKNIADGTSGMRLFNKRMIKQFGYNINYRPEPDTIAFLLNHNAKIEEIQVSMNERIAGNSYLNLKNSFFYMVHVLFNILIFQWIRKD